jgi:hypothetical protein
MAKGEIAARTIPRKNGPSYILYQGEYRDRDGERRFVSCKVEGRFNTPSKAEKEARRLLREAENEVEAWIRAKGKETVGQAIDEYVYHLKKAQGRGDCTNAHVRNSETALKKCPPRIRREALSSFKDSGLIKDEINRLRDSGLSIYNATALRDSLRRVFGFAMESPRGYIPRNVLADFPIYLPPCPGRANHASPEEALAVIAAARDSITEGKLLTGLTVYAILCLVIQTGIRPEEAGGLLVGDIETPHPDYPNDPDIWGKLTVRNTNTRLDGFQTQTKAEKLGSKKKRAPIPLVGGLFREAFFLMERYHQALKWSEGPGHRSYKRGMVIARANRRFRDSDEPVIRRTSGFAFVGQWGGAYNAGSLCRHIRDIVIRAGFVKRDHEGRILIDKDGNKKNEYSLYSFRHMVATFNAKNLPVHLAAAVTGHDKKTFLGTYVHQSAGDHLQIAGSLGKLEALVNTNLPAVRKRLSYVPKNRPWEAEGVSRTTYYRLRGSATNLQQGLKKGGK